MNIKMKIIIECEKQLLYWNIKQYLKYKQTFHYNISKYNKTNFKYVQSSHLNL